MINLKFVKRALPTVSTYSIFPISFPHILYRTHGNIRPLTNLHLSNMCYRATGQYFPLNKADAMMSVLLMIPARFDFRHWSSVLHRRRQRQWPDLNPSTTRCSHCRLQKANLLSAFGAALSSPARSSSPLLDVGKESQSQSQRVFMEIDVSDCYRRYGQYI